MADGQGREASVHRTLITRLRTEYTDRAFAVSRAIDPSTRRELESAGLKPASLPLSGGRTIWDAVVPGSVCIIDSPNHLGLLELVPGAAEWIGANDGCEVDDSGHLVDTRTDASLVNTARRLHRRLVSIRGVRSYHDAIAAPWFTVLANDPSDLVTGRESFGQPLGSVFPDVPGGVRVAVPPDASAADTGRYAAAVESAIAAKHESGS